MNPIKRVYCRVFQFAFHVALPFLPYREPEVFDSIEALPPLLKKLKAKSVLLVTDQQLRKNGTTKPLEDLLENEAIKCVVYDDTIPNPIF